MRRLRLVLACRHFEAQTVHECFCVFVLDFSEEANVDYWLFFENLPQAYVVFLLLGFLLLFHSHEKFVLIDQFGRINKIISPLTKFALREVHEVSSDQFAFDLMIESARKQRGFLQRRA